MNRENELQQRQKYNDNLWSEQQMTEAQKYWIKWMSDAQTNSSEGLITTFDGEFQMMREKMLGAAPTPTAKDALKLKMDDFGVQLYQGVLRLEATNRAKNTISAVGGLLSQASDLVAQSPELYRDRQDAIRRVVDESFQQRRIDEKVYAGMIQDVDELAAQAAEASIATNPARAREILDGAKNISWQRRHAIQNEIERASQDRKNLDRYVQDQLLKSNLESLEQTGKPITNFSVDTYVAAQPQNEQPVARRQAEGLIQLSKKTYVGRTEIVGHSTSEIAATLQRYKPSENSDTYFADQQVYENLMKVADQQVRLLHEDPFTYSRQNPLADEAWKQVENLPKDASPETVVRITETALETSAAIQRQLGVPENSISVMSRDSARTLAGQLNQGTPEQVQQTLSLMSRTYGEFYPRAFADLVRLPEGERANAGMQLVALHVGKPFLADFIQVMRTPMADIRVEPQDWSSIKEYLFDDPGMVGLRGAMLSANPGNAKLTSDYQDAIGKYAASIYSRGMSKNPKQAVKDASMMLISSEYGFININDTPVAIRRTQGQSKLTDHDVNEIGYYMGRYTRDINPATLDRSKFFIPKEISQDAALRTMRMSLDADSFWVTNPENDGATLYVHGLEGSVSPVLDNMKRPVAVNFMKLLAAGRSIVSTPRESIDIPYWALP